MRGFSENRETRMPVSSFGGGMPAQYAGQLDMNGDALRAPSIHERPYACCTKALVMPSSCVCFFESTCPEHGHRHNGTHD